ncbi:hypothetical protein KAJ27_21785 [bacterium]|nr:hypothetical protein [bacterium]
MNPYDSKFIHTNSGVEFILIKLPERICDDYQEYDDSYYSIEDYRNRFGIQNYERAKAEINYSVGKKTLNIAFECSEINYICQKFVGLLCVYRRQIKQTNPQGSIVLVSSTIFLKRILEICKLTEIFDYSDSEMGLIKSNHGQLVK